MSEGRSACGKFKYKSRHKIVNRRTPVGVEYRTECGHAVSKPAEMSERTKDMDLCVKCFSEAQREIFKQSKEKK